MHSYWPKITALWPCFILSVPAGIVREATARPGALRSKLINSKGHSPSWEAYSNSAAQDTLHHLKDEGKVIPVQATKALRAVRHWGSHIFKHSAHRWRQGRQPYVPPIGNFLVLISVRGWVDPRAIVLLEELGQLKKFTSSGTRTASAIYETKKLHVRKSPLLDPIMGQINPIHSPITLMSVSVLSFHLHLGLLSDPIISDFRSTILHEYHLSHACCLSRPSRRSSIISN
jgi:hypothetical protein